MDIVDPNEAEYWSNLLHQDESWIDREQVTHSLDDMEPRHCANVHAFLLRQAETYLLNSMWSMSMGTGPSGDVACDAFDSEFSRLEAASEKPQEWMSQQPLLVALARRAEGKPARPVETKEMKKEMILIADRNDDFLYLKPQERDPLTEFAEWIVALDDIDGPGAEARRTVTLNKIIERAREALDGNDRKGTE
jgi:hypothetical protein